MECKPTSLVENSFFDFKRQIYSLCYNCNEKREHEINTSGLSRCMSVFLKYMYRCFMPIGCKSVQ